MNFYLLKRPPRRDNKIPLSTTENHRGCIIVNCPACGTRGIVGPNLTGKLPVEILVRDAAYLDDIEQASTTLLASRKFREAAEGLSGIEYYPPVGYELKRDVPKYQDVLRMARDQMQLEVIRVFGRGGSVAKNSGIQLTKSCDTCGWRAWALPDNGFHIDESQWDGSDFFHVLEYGPFFMSERAVEKLQAAELSNFGFVRAEEFRHPLLGRK